MVDIPPESPPAQEQVIAQKLVDCGLKAEGFTVRYEDYLQSIEVVITPAVEVTADHFPCIHTAVFPEIVTFENRAMYQEYMAYVGELFRPQMLADSEAALRQRGLWEGFPERGAFPTFADYVRALEAHAGFAPGSVLQLDGGDRVAILFAETIEPAEISYEQFATLLTVLKFASTGGEFTLGFIGNEKIRE